MDKADCKNEDVALALNCSYHTACKKTRGATPITTDEAQIISDMCKMDNDTRCQVFLQ